MKTGVAWDTRPPPLITPMPDYTSITIETTFLRQFGNLFKKKKKFIVDNIIFGISEHYYPIYDLKHVGLIHNCLLITYKGSASIYVFPPTEYICIHTHIHTLSSNIDCCTPYNTIGGVKGWLGLLNI